MARPRRVPLPNFGDRLRLARAAAGMSQAAAVERLANRPSFTQASLAQYENGRIGDPDPAVLRDLAEAYGTPYIELLLELVREKYGLGSGPAGEREAAQLHVLAATLARAADAELAQRHLEALAAVAEHRDLLTNAGLAQWQRDYDPLDILWIVAPDFLDDRDPNIRRAVVHNIERNATMVYFIPQRESEPGGRFDRLRRLLVRENPGRLTEERVSSLTRAVPLQDRELDWLMSDLVIANPHSSNVDGYQYIRDPRPELCFGVRLSQFQLGRVVSALSIYAESKNVNITTPAPGVGRGR